MNDLHGEEALQYFEHNYMEPVLWNLPTPQKMILPATTDQTCRFCGQRPPDVSYKLEAHALPESIGNRSLFTKYECDACNRFFGSSIENDFGNWSKPARTFSRIRGKSGVPTIKKGSGGGWRIDFNEQGDCELTGEEAEGIFEDDKDSRRLTFRLRRDPHAPVAVLKAFVKMGISLLPHAEVPNFRHAIAWLRADGHRHVAPGIPLLHTFLPGTTAKEKIAAAIIRRKDQSIDVPYMLFLLLYGNDLFQVNLPSAKDLSLCGKPLPTVHFPVDGAGLGSSLLPPRREVINLNGTEPIRDGVVEITLGYGAPSLGNRVRL
jgi:hypothetical protein